jgi:mutator protein MutT
MQIVAKAIITDKDGKILILRRSSTHPHYAYHPDFPGGTVEVGEDPLEAVVREIAEEAGLDIPPVDLHQIGQHQRSAESLDLVYIAKLSQAVPAITISWEHDQSEWLEPTELLHANLPDNVDPSYLTTLNHIRRRQVEQFSKTINT